MNQKLPPLIAIVGTDGSGKTTLCQILLTWMQQKRPTALCHLGRQTGNIGRTIARVPFIGRKIDKKVQTQTHKAKKDKGPNGLLAIAIFAFSLRRVFRFCKMLRIRKRGIAIITDRFPQVSVREGLEGPDLSLENPKSFIANYLTKIEWQLYRWMADHKPDLVIRLNVDIETAMKRKPDHKPASLERKITSLSKITYNGAPIIDIDATLPLQEVVKKAQKAIDDIIKEKSYKSPNN